MRVTDEETMDMVEMVLGQGQQGYRQPDQPHAEGGRLDRQDGCSFAPKIDAGSTTERADARHRAGRRHQQNRSGDHFFLDSGDFIPVIAPIGVGRMAKH